MKYKKRLLRFLNSVFTKLFIILVATGVIINFLVIQFVHTFVEEENEVVKKNVHHYLSYVMVDLGNPPSLEKARELAKKTDFEIRYESPELSWSTSETLPTIKELYSMKLERLLFSPPGNTEPEVWHLEPCYEGLFMEREFVDVKYGPGRFIFSLSERYLKHTTFIRIVIIGLVILLTGIIALAYILIRKILNPMLLLTEGVRQVGRGNLDYRVDVKRKDELGEMAKAFNEMTAKIYEMIHAREQLLLDVSHELRSPLTRMKVAMEFMPESNIKNNIREDVWEMEKMVTEILETARLRNKNARINIRRVNLTDLVRDTASSLGHIPPGIDSENMPDTLIANAAPDLIQTVLKNVMENSLKYSHDSGLPVVVTGGIKRGYVFIKIRDKGIGIPKEDIPYIFEPFYRVDKSRSKETGGYGLGLNLCKTIMEAHKGKIEIEPQKKGVVATLYLPTSG